MDLGFILVTKVNYRKYKYDFQRGQGPGDIRNLTVEMVIDWFQKTFPSLPDHLARQRKADYCEAIFKFTDFLHFELELWPQDQRELLRRKIGRHVYCTDLTIRGLPEKFICHPILTDVQ